MERTQRRRLRRRSKWDRCGGPGGSQPSRCQRPPLQPVCTRCEQRNNQKETSKSTSTTTPLPAPLHCSQYMSVESKYTTRVGDFLSLTQIMQATTFSPAWARTVNDVCQLIGTRHVQTFEHFIRSNPGHPQFLHLERPGGLPHLQHTHTHTCFF